MDQTGLIRRNRRIFFILFSLFFFRPLTLCIRSTEDSIIREYRYTTYSRRIDLPNANAKYLSRQFRYVVSTVLDDAGVNLFPDSSVALRFLMQTSPLQNPLPLKNYIVSAINQAGYTVYDPVFIGVATELSKSSSSSVSHVAIRSGIRSIIALGLEVGNPPG